MERNSFIFYIHIISLSFVSVHFGPKMLFNIPFGIRQALAMRSLYVCRGHFDAVYLRHSYIGTT